VQASASANTAECPPVEGSSERVTRFSAPPPMCIDPAKTYAAKVVTDVGEFTIALDAAKAPTTVNNFVVLSRYHFYDGVGFHRVIKGFMAQGGDPQGTGSGGPGYEFKDELPEPGQYAVGSVAMANAGPNTNGSQFFIVTGDDGVALRPDYSLFGQVSEGMDTVRAIEADGTTGEGTPSKIHTITSVTITES
jgi:cyclophilin family peptidyl-prolyl cis-trans isomerase